MKTSDLSFDLPEELIAQHPADRRGTSRLLVVARRSGTVTHSTVGDVNAFVPNGAVMVFNNTEVRKARLYGTPSSDATSATQKLEHHHRHSDPGETKVPGSSDHSGPRQEFLLVDRLSQLHWSVIARNAKRVRPGRQYYLPENRILRVLEVRENRRVVEISPPLHDRYLRKHGHVPLPPYIRREDEPKDDERYQTVYARSPGSIAAPTAGLHFTPDILSALTAQGVSVEHVTLHVGLGTFEPVRTENVADHAIHSEEYHVSPATADRLTVAKQTGRPIVAVGTTVVRTLESAWDPAESRFRPGQRSTNLYIYPGYAFQVVDHLFTNFHTPRSSLLAMVSAFAGYETIMRAYRIAVSERYRFFSYGDAMLLL